MADRGPDWAAWVERLPGLVRGLYDDWALRPDGWMMHGYTSLVVPVVQERGGRAVLKVTFPEVETEHEHLALAHWGGRGAVRMFRADPHRRAMLLDPLRDESLRDAWDVEACEAVAGLYGLLHVPALRQLRLLSDITAATADQLAGLPRSAPLPHRLVEQAVSLARTFATDPATDGTLVHMDLHYDNVLMSEAGEWVAIDPKPLSGDPHVELTPMLFNRYDELAAGAQGVRAGVRRRFHTLVDAAGLDEERARDWVVVRMLDLAASRLLGPPELHRGMPDSEWFTLCVTIAKAVQD
jgi:streptomycin 6-kinase